MFVRFGGNCECSEHFFEHSECGTASVGEINVYSRGGELNVCVRVFLIRLCDSK